MSTLKTNNIQHVDLADPSILLNSDGSVSIAGTVSYEDATNVDSVGVVTARKQLHVGTGVSVKAGGLNVTAGITTVQALQATTGTFSAAVSGTTGTFTGETDVQNSILRVTDSTPRIVMSVPSGGRDTRFFNDGSGNFIIGHGENSDTPAERVRISAVGDFGIGNNSPDCRLSVKDVAEHTAYASATPSVGDCMVQLYNNPSNETTNDHSTIQFGVNGGSHNRVNTISAVAESAGNRKMAFAFCTDEAGSRTEKLRITGDGQVFIGNSITSSYDIVVSRNTNGNLVTQLANLNTGNASKVFLQLQTGSDRYVNLENDYTSQYFQLQGNNLTTAYYSFDTQRFRTNSGTERLHIASDGHVKFGSGAPVNVATVEIQNADPVLLIRDTAETSASGDCKLAFGNNSAYPTAYISHSWDGTNGNLHFHTRVSGNEYERLTLYASGVLDVKEGNMQLSKQGQANFMEIGLNQNSNQFAYIDLIGDSTYTDFGFRMLRGSGGANADNQLISRGTGKVQIVAQDAGSIELMTTNSARMTISPIGLFDFNGVKKYYNAFTLVNNTEYTFDIAVPAEGGAGNSQLTIAGYNHYYTTSYGAHRIVMTSSRGTSVGVMGEILNQTHAQSGAWTVSKTNSSNWRITKTAGTYGGSGYGFIEFTTRG